MHVGGITVDLNWLLQFILTLFLIALGLLHLVKNTASRYFEVDANFDRHRPPPMPAIPMDPDKLPCTVCGDHAPKKCSRCKSVRYCSLKCQKEHWNSGHNKQCKVNLALNAKPKSLSGIALVPTAGSTKKAIKEPKKVLFPYYEFVKLFNWEKPGFPPCGLLNCGNSCFANVVLQCLVSTRPLVAYLLDKGHRRECRRNDWCFLCEFQTHVERASQSTHPFSPINILSRLPNIGGNLGYGRQEDAHEFMRFAIDTMQSVCLDEYGGEKAVDPSSQETTLIQHIFGGHLQSQVICTKCNKISDQFENMMDLTVEIHGDASSLEECLDQFTAKEWLHGDNMYKCDGCNDYVKAWKRLTVRRAPNVLTIALKRFQSGRFGKLNKRVSFPETLDLSPYMSEQGDGIDVYKLYAVVVHVDMLNASFFGHYICYTKDFRGNWYRIDDCKVVSVELEEVLSQGAYMLLYRRVSVRPSSLRTDEAHENGEEKATIAETEIEPSLKEAECEAINHISSSVSPNTSFSSVSSRSEIQSCGVTNIREQVEDDDVIKFNKQSSFHEEVSGCDNVLEVQMDPEAIRDGTQSADMGRYEAVEDIELSDSKEVSRSRTVGTEAAQEHPLNINMVIVEPRSFKCDETQRCQKDLRETDDGMTNDSEDVDVIMTESRVPVEEDSNIFGGICSLSTGTSPDRRTNMVQEVPINIVDVKDSDECEKSEVAYSNLS